MADSLKVDVERSVVRTAVAQVLPSIAKAMVGWTPEKINEAFAHSDNFIKYALPLASTGLGVVISSLIGRTVKNEDWADKIKDVFDDVRAAFTYDYSAALRQSHGETLEKLPAGSAEALFPSNEVIIDPDDPIHYHNHACQVVPRYNIVPAVPASDKKPGRPARKDPRTDLGSMRPDQVIHTPRMPAACCSGLFFADAQLLAERAAKIAKASVPAPKKEEKANSLQAFLGRAESGKIKGVDQAKLGKLRDLLALLNMAQLAELDAAINSEDEFMGLFLARNVQDLLDMIVLAKDRVVHGHFAEALGITAASAHKATAFIQHAWKEMGEWAEAEGRRADERTAKLERDRAARPVKPQPVPMTEGPGMRLWRRLFCKG